MRGRRNGVFDVFGAALCDLRERLAGGRIEHLEPAATGRVALFAIDPVGQSHPGILPPRLAQGAQIDCMRPPSTARLTPLT